MKSKSLFIPLCSLAIVASACSGGGDSSSKTSTLPSDATVPAVTKEPIELNFLFGSEIVDFDKKYAEQVRKKYPNFSLKQVAMSPQQAIATNTPVDIMFNSVTGMVDYFNAGMVGDISDLTKKHKIDLNRFEPTTVEMLAKLADGKQIGLPYKNINLVMFYNKDIFDKFGIPYPKDAMTWETTLDLAKKLTRNESGIQYVGFAADLSSVMAENSYSLDVVDPKTFKVTYGQDNRWNKFISTLVPLFTMPGYNATADMLSRNSQSNLFRKEGRAAMWISDHSNYPNAAESANLKWDVVSIPEFDDIRGIGPQPLPAYMLVSATSKHKDEALLAVAQLASDEVQIWNAKELLNATVLKNQAAKDAFGQGNPLFQGKNLRPFNPTKFAPPPTITRFNNDGRTPLNNAVNDVILGKKDLNTALREASETANKAIEAKIASEKGK
ncbi:MAG: hypothetical protein K0Q59_3470 [Paenibacillus sp.]|nr:hypothetical protein [Paenibacillus sp.]